MKDRKKNRNSKKLIRKNRRNTKRKMRTVNKKSGKVGGKTRRYHRTYKKRKGGGLFGDIIGEGIGIAATRQISKSYQPKLEKMVYDKLQKCADENKKLKIKYGLPLTDKYKNVTYQKGSGILQDMLLSRGEYEVANIGLVEKKRYFRKLLRECEEENYQIRKKFEPETNPKRKWIFA